VRDFHFSADGSRLFVMYSGRDGAVWDLKASPPTEKPEFAKSFGDVDSFALSHDENRLYVAFGPAVRGFDRAADGWRERRPLVGAAHAVGSLAFGADGRTLYAADDSETARAWTLDGNRFVEAGRIDQIGRWIQVTPDDRTLLGGTRAFTLWDAATRTRRTPDGLDRRIYTPVHSALSGDGRWLVRGNFKPALTLFDLAGPEPRRHAVVEKFGSNNRSVAAVAISPDGRYVVAAPDQSNQPEPLQVWRVTPQGLQPLALPYVTGSRVAFAPDGGTLAVADAKSLTLVDLREELPVVRPPVEFPNGRSRPLDVMFTADGARIVTVRERTVDVWTVKDGKKQGSLELPTGPESAALAPDGRHLAVGNKNGTVWVVRLP